VNNREQAARLEINTIQPIPVDARHGTARDLFSVWFGSNLMLLTIVTGGLAVTVFALPFGWAIVGLVVGNLVGAVFMALHAAQGPTLGVPQMVQTRGQFGSLGSLLVVGIVIIMYLGFLSSNLVIGGEAMVRVANFAAALVIARVHGTFVFGLYATSLAIATMAVMFADNGLQTSAITELGNNRQASTYVIGQLYLAKTALIIAMLVFLLLIGWWLRISHLAWMMGALVTLRTIIQSYSQLQMSILKSIGRMKVIGVVQGIHSAILLCGTGLALKQGWGILGLLGLLVAGQTLEAALIARGLWRAGIWPTWPDAGSCWTLILRSAPLGIAYGLANLIVRLDTIVLAALIPMSEMGQFSAADMILVIIYVVAWLSGSVLLPEMIRRAGTRAT